MDLVISKVVHGVRTIEIHHKHPACVLTRELDRQLNKAIDVAIQDKGTRVIILSSGDPDFFIAHYDITRILQWVPKFSEQRELVDRHCELLRNGDMAAFSSAEKLKRCSKPSIAIVAGRCGGGGNELISGADMRFGLRGKTVFNQMEVPLGLLPGGNGTVNLPRIVGRGRAMEMILGAIDVDADTAERWGYLNRVFDSREELTAHVTTLANRVANFPPQAIANAKQSILNSLNPAVSTNEALAEEWRLFVESLLDPAAKLLMEKAVRKGAQTRPIELTIGNLAPYLEYDELVSKL